MSYEQGGKPRLLVHLQLQEPSSASFPSLIKLREGTVGAAADGTNQPTEGTAADCAAECSDCGSGLEAGAEEHGTDAQQALAAAKYMCSSASSG